MGQRYEALRGGGWVAKTSKKSVTDFVDGPIEWKVNVCESENQSAV